MKVSISHHLTGLRLVAQGIAFVLGVFLFVSAIDAFAADPCAASSGTHSCEQQDVGLRTEPVTSPAWLAMGGALGLVIMRRRKKS
jgi:hypothetical protein